MALDRSHDQRAPLGSSFSSCDENCVNRFIFEKTSFASNISGSPAVKLGPNWDAQTVRLRLMSPSGEMRDCGQLTGYVSSLRCQISDAAAISQGEMTQAKPPDAQSAIPTNSVNGIVVIKWGDRIAPKPSGGARRDRTDDLMLAKHALSQLSYGPEDRARPNLRR